MRFATAVPWWAIALLMAVAVAGAWWSYTGAVVPLSRRRRAVLIALRATTLLLLLACLFRPVRVLPADAGPAAIVPILVDVSRSMSLADADGRTRLDAARDIVGRLRQSLAGRFVTEPFTFGASLKPAEGEMVADANRSDLSGAMNALLERYRGRPLAGVVVVSDGGDTGVKDAPARLDAAAIPVFTIGVGQPRLQSDLEVLDVSAGDASLSGSAVDLTVAAVNRGTGPFDLRVLENGRPVDVRRITPDGPGSVVRTTLTVSPAADAPTVYTVEIPASPDDPVLENNRRSIVVEPPGRKRHVLVIEGAPGFEHSFIKRALAADPGLDIDSVVRKGRNEHGEPTYFVQSTDTRARQLTTGFPGTREALYQYDAVILANVEPDTLSGVQFESLSSFVAGRGGGLLVLGARTFAQQGLVGTALNEALPLSLSARDAGVVRTAADPGDGFGVVVTAEGATHPVMRIGGTAEETARRWSAVPALAGASLLGGARPGALVLASVLTSSGMRPLVAVQRYGRGRTMVFTGEASWRWKMHLPSTDMTYELFWRHAARWLASDAPDPLTITVPASIATGDTVAVAVDVRDAAFAPVADAQVSMEVTEPGGAPSTLKASLADPGTGRYSVDVPFERPGLYRLRVSSQRSATGASESQRWVLVGGADRELTDPRLNEDVLRRLSRATGGSYLDVRDIGGLASELRTAGADTATPRVQELWHNVWVFAAFVVLLSSEWVLRRTWGLK